MKAEPKSAKPERVQITPEMILELYRVATTQKGKQRKLTLEKCKLLSEHLGQYILL